MNAPIALQVQDLDVALDHQQIIHDCNFQLHSGRTLGLLGPNGTGKTTLLRAIAGILSPTAGQVFVQGQDIAQLKPRQRAKLLTYVGQEELPSGDLTVAQVLAMGRLPHRSPWIWGDNSDPDGQAAIARAARLLGLEDLLDAACHQLSGGQKRRVLLGRGLAQDTPVLLLDEPTNHLDIHHQLELLAMLRQTKTTVVCSLHDVDLARGYCDDVAIVQDGVLAAFGPTEQTLTPAILREVFAVNSSAVQSASREHLVLENALRKSEQ